MNTSNNYETSDRGRGQDDVDFVGQKLLEE